MPVPADFLWATSLEHSEMGCATDGIHENSTNTTKKTNSGTSGTLVFMNFTQECSLFGMLGTGSGWWSNGFVIRCF